MKYTLLAIALLTLTFSFAQNDKSAWKITSKKESAIVVENKKDLSNPRLFELDMAQLKQSLASAPKRFTSSQSNVIVSFPDNEGKLERFSIMENSNMDPALAARFPEIKSYIGKGIDNPTATVYFSISPLGLQSMATYADRSAIFIEPFTTDLSAYVVYRKADRAASLTKFECRAIASAQEELLDAGIMARPNADDAFLRTYRLAVSVTGEYTAYFGGTKPLALAGINNSMTRVNAIFEMDFGVHMNLIANNDLVIYTDAATDPYSIASVGTASANSNNANGWGIQLQNTLTSVLGNAAYDIGHLFGASGGGGNAGCIGCVCVNDTASTTDKNKGSGYTSPPNAIPAGDTFDIDYVAHEMGHQFGANHTWTHGGNEGSGAQMEPGSGSTIMGYAGITSLDVQQHSDAYFHAISIQQVTNYIKTTSCQTNTATGNAIPVVSAGADYTIPKGTPFMLTGTATDVNGDALTYDWEQMDNQTNATAPNATKTSGVNFRSYNPTTSPIRYFPNMTSVLAGLTATEGDELTVEAVPSVARTLNFRLTVRDNHVGGPANNSDDTVIAVNATAGPFSVTVPNTNVSYAVGSTPTITWTIAGTTANNVNCANVDILISTNGGTSWTTLLAATPNDGSQAVTIPNNIGTTNRIMVKGTNHIFFDVSNTNFTITATPDVTAPTAPTLTASGTTTTTTNLSWSASTDNVAVIGYDVYKDGVFLGSTTTATTYAVTGLTASTTYAFTVKAKDGAGNVSVASNTVNVTTLAPDNTPPTAPTLTASVTTSTSTNLSWSGATDNVAVTGYDVFKDGVLLGSTTTATTYAVTGLTPTTTYAFTVKAKDGSGNISPASNIVSVTTTLFTYCTSQGSIVTDELIGRVQLGTINNISTGGTGYTDFTAISTNLGLGTNQTIIITPTWPGIVYSEGYAVFIDYNQDGDFTDSGETVWSNPASTATPVSGTFTVPANATLGATRMRVSLKYNGVPTACESFQYGQVEDYTVVIQPANSVVTVKLNIQGYYDTVTHAMRPVKANQLVGSSAIDVDNITLELRNAANVLIASTTSVLQIDGTAVCTFPTAPSGSFYLVVKHRNAIETWSATVQTVGPTPLVYDFRTAANKAYGNNMVQVEAGIFALYSGDIDQDGNIDNLDYSVWEHDANNLEYGYFTTDLDGEGNVNNLDYSVWEYSANNLIYVRSPFN